MKTMSEYLDELMASFSFNPQIKVEENAETHHIWTTRERWIYGRIRGYLKRNGN